MWKKQLKIRECYNVIIRIKGQCGATIHLPVCWCSCHCSLLCFPQQHFGLQCTCAKLIRENSGLARRCILCLTLSLPCSLTETLSRLCGRKHWLDWITLCGVRWIYDHIAQSVHKRLDLERVSMNMHKFLWTVIFVPFFVVKHS